MSIDNLPAQLPKDSTEFFGDRLMPVLTSLVQEGLKSSIIQGATITSKSQLQAKHAWLKPHMTSNKKKVLILGSGFVAGPVARVLGSRNDVELVIGSNQEEEAKKLASLSQNGAAIEQFNVQNEERLRQIIDGSSIVISLLPATMHLPVAQACLGSRAHLVTASYISPQMQSLHQQYTKSLLNYRYCRAVDKKLVFLNEIGLDPGLDHLSAKKIIDEAHNSGHQIKLFTSWCGGLPAPECADNPLGYKFSWSPRGVLLAALNDARYRWEDEEVRIPGEQLLAVARQNPFPSRLNLEGIPNRDSLKYERLYGLEGIPTMLRGTLRYTGFCELMKCFRSMGLLDTSPVSGEFATLTNWGQVFPKLSTKDLYPKQLEAITWLGLSSNEERFIPKTSMLDSFCELLQKKLKYLPGERDMVVMQHEFIIKRADGGEERKSSSLIEYGDPNGFSAMARTVGYPVVVATEMILDGKVQEVGVIAPLLPSLYNPMLSRLEQLAGITFKECNKGV